MKSIITWGHKAITAPFSALDLSPLPGKSRGKLRLSPVQLLEVTHARFLATWALAMTQRVCKPRLPAGPGGRPVTYAAQSVLLMAIVQIAWRKSYEQIVDWVAMQEDLALALGFSRRPGRGRLQTISQGQYWERRQALGAWPFFFFFLALVAQLIRLGAITGKELVVDSTLLAAWYHNDPDATWQKYAGRGSLFGYKIHTLLCRQAVLPVFVLVTPAHVHDSLVGWFIVLVAALVFSFKVLVVYADAGYFDKRFFTVVHNILGAHPAVDYNLRRAGKKKLVTLFFIEQWKRLVIAPRTDIERHFAWVKRYFGLQDFQGFRYRRVLQFVLLTYIAVLAVALAATRFQRPELVRRRAMVLALI